MTKLKSREQLIQEQKNIIYKFEALLKPLEELKSGRTAEDYIVKIKAYEEVIEDIEKEIEIHEEELVELMNGED